MGITTISFIYKKAVSESHSSDTAFCCLSEIWVKYSPPIEAGASYLDVVKEKISPYGLAAIHPRPIEVGVFLPH